MNQAAREVIGKWSDEGMPGGSVVTIYREGGKLYLQVNYKIDGSSSNDEVAETQTPLGRRFQTRDPEAADYAVVGSDGGLQWFDEQGLIRAARKIE